LKAWNEGTPKFSQFSDLFDQLKVRSALLDNLFASAIPGTLISSRNNAQASYGFSFLNQKKNALKEFTKQFLR
jgi:hypothetical protein